MEQTERLWKSRGKDASPEQTVARIQALLRQHGFESTYEPQPPQMDTCYCSRVTVNDFGSNGKGFSPQLCKASGYAELMERMQNKVLSIGSRRDSDYYRKMNAWFPTDDLQGHVHPSVQQIKDKLTESARQMGEPDPEAAVARMLRSWSVDGHYVMRKFYSVSEDREVLLPVTFFQTFTGTNGMAAGNTLAEAIVQGLSEILERHATMRILYEGLTPPEIPRSFLREACPSLYDLILRIEENPNYHVTVLDASLGQGIPCVASVIYNTATLTAGIKFGAYPDLRVALERCFSESMQGWILEEFTKTGTVTYSPIGRSSWTNLLNIMKVSKGMYPATLLCGQPAWAFTPWPAVPHGDNRQLLYAMLALLKALGKDIYIQDVSFMDFPSVYIYVPEMSEISPVDMLWMHECEMKRDAQYLFADLEAVGKPEAKKLLDLARIKQRSYMDNVVSQLACASFRETMPGGADEMGFLAAVCCLYLDMDKEALSFLAGVPRTPYIKAVQHYITARRSGLSHERAEDLLTKLSGPDVAKLVCDQFADRTGILPKIYPRCTGRCGSCGVDCSQPRIQQDYEKLLFLDKQKDLGAENIRALFV